MQRSRVNTPDSGRRAKESAILSWILAAYTGAHPDPLRRFALASRLRR
jgi:hypothetical protein